MVVRNKHTVCTFCDVTDVSLFGIACDVDPHSNVFLSDAMQPDESCWPPPPPSLPPSPPDSPLALPRFTVSHPSPPHADTKSFSSDFIFVTNVVLILISISITCFFVVKASLLVFHAAKNMRLSRAV
jgi:hypothetical protein